MSSCYSIWHVFLKSLSAILSGMLLWNFYLPFYLTCDLNVLSSTRTDMLFKFLSATLPDMLIENSICHSIWQMLLETSISHSVWHVDWNFYLLPYLACWLKFLSAIVSNMFVDMSICHPIWHVNCHFYMLLFLTCWTNFYLQFYLKLWFEISTCYCYSIWLVFPTA